MYQKVNELVYTFEKAPHNKVVATCDKVKKIETSVKELQASIVQRNLSNNNMYGLQSVKEVIPVPILNS